VTKEQSGELVIREEVGFWCVELEGAVEAYVFSEDFQRSGSTCRGE